MFQFIKKHYPPNYAFLILTILELFMREVCKFPKKQANFYHILLFLNVCKQTFHISYVHLCSCEDEDISRFSNLQQSLSQFLRRFHFYGLFTAYLLYEEVMSVRLYANHSHKKCDYFEHNKLNKHLADDNCLSVRKIGSFSEKKQKLNCNLKQ